MGDLHHGLPLPMTFVPAAKIGIGAKKGGIPTRLDHFEAFKPEPDKNGDYQPHTELNEWLKQWAKSEGLSKVTQVPINFFFSDIERNWYATLACFRKSHTFCRNIGWRSAPDGVDMTLWQGEARRAVLGDDDRPKDWKIVGCNPGSCPFWGTDDKGKPAGCAPYGHLLFRIDRWNEGAPIYFSTRGWASIRSIQTGLAYASKEFMGRLADVELRLTLGTKSPYVSAVKRRQTIYVVSLEFGNAEAELERIKDKAIRRTEALRALATNESALAALQAGRYEELKALPSGAVVLEQVVEPVVTAAADAEREMADPDKHLGEFVEEGTYTAEVDDGIVEETNETPLLERGGLPVLPEEPAVEDGDIWGEELELTSPPPSEDELLAVAYRIYGPSESLPALCYICESQYDNEWGKLSDDEARLLQDRLAKLESLYTAARAQYGERADEKLGEFASSKGADRVEQVALENIASATAAIERALAKARKGAAK